MPFRNICAITTQKGCLVSRAMSIRAKKLSRGLQRKESATSVHPNDQLYTVPSPNRKHPESPRRAIHADRLADALPEGAQAVALLPAHLLQHLEAQVLVCQFLLGKLQVLGFLRTER